MESPFESTSDFDWSLWKHGTILRSPWLIFQGDNLIYQWTKTRIFMISYCTVLSVDGYNILGCTWITEQNRTGLNIYIMKKNIENVSFFINKLYSNYLYISIKMQINMSLQMHHRTHTCMHAYTHTYHLSPTFSTFSKFLINIFLNIPLKRISKINIFLLINCI